MSEFEKNYKILSEIGSGGLGKVFKAVDLRNQRNVAIKVLHEQHQRSTRFIGIFHRELLTISRLKHKNIVEFLDCNFDPPFCCIVTEFIDGWSLHNLLKIFPRFPPLVALSICFDVLKGIDYLHLHDTVHSDLSSPNVLIDKGGRVLLTDFGLSVRMGVEDYRNAMVGTPGYYSPEHVTLAGITAASDLYCIGLLLFEMIVGRKAIGSSKERRETVSRMKAIDFSPLSTFESKLAKDLTKILKKALRFSTSGRYNTAEAMMIDVYHILKKYNIRFTRYAVHQFLADQKLSPTLDHPPQDIYAGKDP